MNGKEAFGKFFRDGVGAGAKLSLDSPIRASQGDLAAMPFTIEVLGMTFRAIDVMRFNNAGKIVHMQAIWSPNAT